MLAAGRALARAGYRLTLYRRRGRPLPRSVDGPWSWPALVRSDRVRPSAPAALTVSAAWGVSAAPAREGPYGRGGPWELECQDVERAYGPDSALHVSLEEFARTLSSSGEDRERLREGGVPARALAGRLARSRRVGDLARFRTAFARFRAFDRPNVLHLFATFRVDRGFAREFPAAVQTGPLWPRRFRRATGRTKGGREWVWYASPASAERIAVDVVAGLEAAEPPVRLYVRTDRRWSLPPPADRVELASGPVAAEAWAKRFARAELRVVTGSRTLLEALELGGPFLYFNGLLGSGARRRRHRPEKIAALLAAWRRAGVAEDLRHDLADFSAGRRVRAVVRRAAIAEGGWARFPRGTGPVGVPPPYDDAGRLLVAIARALARRPGNAARVVARARAGATL
ncbi:MAG: hypothetical protein ACRECT_00485 [Thermoplasmata archaeon]